MPSDETAAQVGWGGVGGVLLHLHQMHSKAIFSQFAFVKADCQPLNTKADLPPDIIHDTVDPPTQRVKELPKESQIKQRGQSLGYYFYFFHVLLSSLSQELYYGCNLITERREGAGFS